MRFVSRRAAVWEGAGGAHTYACRHTAPGDGAGQAGACRRRRPRRAPPASAPSFLRSQPRPSAVTTRAPANQSVQLLASQTGLLRPSCGRAPSPHLPPRKKNSLCPPPPPSVRTHVSVSPNARSSMSASSSLGSFSCAYTCGSRMTWHVEHARLPSHAPSSSTSCACAT